ncbi:hypothetical protein ACNOYE_27440 [Nannocystaceae bacterium ST9]
MSAIRQCTGCGAVVEFAGALVSIRCGYCDSPLVDEARATGRVDAVVPFRIPQRGALDRLRTYLDGKRWAPRELQRLRVDGHGLRGVLVPFWAYEGVVRSEYRSKVGIHWYRTETYTDSEGKTQTRTVTETEWFELGGSAARQVTDHLVTASVGLAESEANEIEPFDLGWAQPFDARLLAGYEAELPSVATRDADSMAAVELRDLEAARITHTLLPGDVNQLSSIRSRVEISARKLLLLPIWIATYHHGQGDSAIVLRLLVNGQTGEVVGDVPVSRWKIAAVVLAGLLLAGLIALIVWLSQRGGPT